MTEGRADASPMPSLRAGTGLCLCCPTKGSSLKRKVGAPATAATHTCRLHIREMPQSPDYYI